MEYSMAFTKMVTALCDRCFTMAEASGQTQAIALAEAKRGGWKTKKTEDGTRLLCGYCSTLSSCY